MHSNSYSFLSVSLNKILHKLWVTEISGSCIVLVHLGNLSHVLVAQREVEDVDILQPAQALIDALSSLFFTSIGYPDLCHEEDVLTLHSALRDGSVHALLYMEHTLASAPRLSQPSVHPPHWR